MAVVGEQKQRDLPSVAGMVAIWSERRFTSFLRRRLLGGPLPSLSLYTSLLFITISKISIFFSTNSIFLRIFPIFLYFSAP